MVERHSQQKRTSSVLFAVIVLVVGSIALPRALGQTRRQQHDPDAFINQQRALQEQMRRRFDAEAGGSQRAVFDWGGWYNLYLFVFDDGVDSSRTLRRHDLRLWGRLSIDKQAHEFYARARSSLLDFNSGDSYSGNDDDVEGPNLERGYYRFDMAKALNAYARRRVPYNVTVKVGRDLVQFGTGLALAVPLDHVSVQSAYRSLELTGFAGKTVGSTQDFDLSRTAKRTRRNLFGLQLRYVGLERHQPFAYAFWQRDRNREARWRPFQKLDYDSFHLGVGSAGELTKGLRYTAECVYETGSSFGHRQFLRTNTIHAWAAQAQLEYLFPGKHNARASVEYLFGSGDADRFASPVNTVGGNAGDSEDTGFIGFGYHDTGLAFAPRPGNLHMGRAGASCYPWPDHARLRRLELGTDWYVFYKHHAAGAVSDPTSTIRSGYLGWEMGCFANWRVTADLAWTTRWGVFFPGKAFRDRTTRTFFLVGMTWSF